MKKNEMAYPLGILRLDSYAVVPHPQPVAELIEQGRCFSGEAGCARERDSILNQ